MGLLSFAARSLDAQRFGLDVVGQNIANVNTEGYSKRVARVLGRRPARPVVGGGGVSIDGVRSMRDRLIDRRLWAETTAEAARVHHQRAAERGRRRHWRAGPVHRRCARRLLRLVRDACPTRRPPRRPGRKCSCRARAWRRRSATRRFACRRAQRDTDLRVRSAVEQVNELAARIAELNVQVARPVRRRVPKGCTCATRSISAVEAAVGPAGHQRDRDGRRRIQHRLRRRASRSSSASSATRRRAGRGRRRDSRGSSSRGDDVTAQVTGGVLGGLARGPRREAGRTTCRGSTSLAVDVGGEGQRGARGRLRAWPGPAASPSSRSAVPPARRRSR